MIKTTAGLVTIFIAISGVDFPKLTITHIGAGNDIDRFGGFSIIDPGKLRLFTLLVEDFDFVNYLSR